jgi:hypothetical protein
MIALVVGFGSVGRKHTSILLDEGFECHIVDPILPNELPPNVVHHYRLEDFLNLASNQFPAHKDFPIVISNWGPDHTPTLLHLSANGFRRFIVEKPVASRIVDIDSVNRLVWAGDHQIWCNYHLRFDSGLAEMLAFSKGAGFGDVSLFVLSGGAKCLSTTGIHWLDFFLNEQSTEIVHVNGDFSNDAKNPRSQDLVYLSGFLYLRLQDSSKFVMSFTNHSYSSDIIQIYWRNHRATIIGGFISIFENEAERELPLTRTNNFGKVVFEGRIKGDGMLNLHRKFQEDRACMDKLTRANLVLLSALKESASNNSEVINDESVDSHDWRIS